MTNEVFELMSHFPGSYIKGKYLWLDSRKGCEILIDGIEDGLALRCELLEWASRSIAKGMPYGSERMNGLYRRSLLLGLNNFLGVNWTPEDIMKVYQYLGNAIDHNKTVLFIESGYNMEVLR